MEQTYLTNHILLASATTTKQLFNVINIHILHYKLSQTSNRLTEKSQSGHSLRDGGSRPFPP
jgi:hypothetical protein